MAKKDHLALLIASLTPAEKKYFVQFTQLRSDDKSYMKLYDAVLKIGEYRAEKFSKQLGKTKANLAHEKKYLIENILKALRNYHDKTKEAELNNLLTDAFILRERRLNEMSISRMKKAGVTARNYGRTEIAWRMQLEERLLGMHVYSEKDFLKQATSNLAQMEKDLAWLHDFTQLQKLYLQTETLYRTRRLARTKQEQQQTARLLKHPILTKRTNDPLFRYFQLNTISSLKEQLNKNDNAVEGLRQMLALVETHYRHLPLDTYEYFLILHGYLIELVHNGQHNEFEKLMTKVRARYYRKLPFNQAYLDSLLDAHAYYYYMVLYGFQAAKRNVRTGEINNLLTGFEKSYEQVVQQFPPGFAVVLSHYACALCFRLGQYEAALRWNLKVIHEGNPAERSEVQATARLVTALLHAELKNFTILPSLVKAANRYLRQHLFLTEVEKNTLSFLNKLPLLHTDAQIAAFKELREKYKQLETTTEGKYRLSTFLYKLWVERNLEEKSRF